MFFYLDFYCSNRFADMWIYLHLGGFAKFPLGRATISHRIYYLLLFFATLNSKRAAPAASCSHDQNPVQMHVSDHFGPIRGTRGRCVSVDSGATCIPVLKDRRLKMEDDKLFGEPQRQNVNDVPESVSRRGVYPSERAGAVWPSIRSSGSLPAMG